LLVVGWDGGLQQRHRALGVCVGFWKRGQQDVGFGQAAASLSLGLGLVPEAFASRLRGLAQHVEQRRGLKGLADADDAGGLQHVSVQEVPDGQSPFGAGFGLLALLVGMHPGPEAGHQSEGQTDCPAHDPGPSGTSRSQV
jgi:hypothetical protein